MRARQRVWFPRLLWCHSPLARIALLVAAHLRFSGFLWLLL